GLHSHVFKVKIQERIYALKLVSHRGESRQGKPREARINSSYQKFRFVDIEDWMHINNMTEVDQVERTRALYNMSEPFNNECRAFGRLQESGYAELAVRCFGYLLLDDSHERAILEQFSDDDLTFDGSPEWYGDCDIRARFPSRDGRPPPVRGILKEFGQVNQPLTTRLVRRLLGDVIRLQQLGIVRIDVADRQIVSGRLSDFSTAVTTPHFMTNPELNPRLSPGEISATEYQLFLYSIRDYYDFDDMVNDWSIEHREGRRKIAVHAFPGCRWGPRFPPAKYRLRSTPASQPPHTSVDPRRYDWRLFTTRAAWDESAGVVKARKAKAGGGKPGRGGVKGRLPLDARPPRWDYDCDDKTAKRLERPGTFHTFVWDFKDGFIIPLNRDEEMDRMHARTDEIRRIRYEKRAQDRALGIQSPEEDGWL
ncbi:hypothetical protein IMZ48_04260, partial [Candidatus Bathyarchaeota archaeon]|nr:hypothetical protein [Candidatus Bathyarchaeota archaeon]